jgi:hypothetical protein
MAELPVINPEKIGKKDRARIESAFSELAQAQEIGNAKSEERAKEELDDAVFDALKLKEKERQQIREGLKSLKMMRLKRTDVDVLVETAEKWKPHKKPKLELCTVADGSFNGWLTFLLENIAVKQLCVFG